MNKFKWVKSVNIDQLASNYIDGNWDRIGDSLMSEMNDYDLNEEEMDRIDEIVSEVQHRIFQPQPSNQKQLDAHISEAIKMQLNGDSQWDGCEKPTILGHTIGNICNDDNWIFPQHQIDDEQGPFTDEFCVMIEDLINTRINKM